MRLDLSGSCLTQKQFVCWLVAVATFTLANTTARAAGFCEDTMKVFASSSKLSDLASTQLREYKWEATKSIAGFKSCNIWRLPDTSIIFACEMARQKSLPSVKKDYSKLEKDVVSCFPTPPWEHNAWDDGINRTFRLKSQGYSGLISIHDGTDDTPQMAPVWNVTLTIYEIEK